jgi:hypothetical protein
MVVTLWNAIIVRRCVWVMDGQLRDIDSLEGFRRKALGAMSACGVMLVVMLLYDVATLVSSASTVLLAEGSGLETGYVIGGIIHESAALLLETIAFAVFIRVLYDVRLVSAELSYLRLDASAVKQDMETLRIAQCCSALRGGVTSSAHIFEGTARTLGGSSGNGSSSSGGSTSSNSNHNGRGNSNGRSNNGSSNGTHGARSNSNSNSSSGSSGSSFLYGSSNRRTADGSVYSPVAVVNVDDNDIELSPSAPLIPYSSASSTAVGAVVVKQVPSAPVMNDEDYDADLERAIELSLKS